MPDQRGISLVGLGLVLALTAFVAFLAIRLVPLYLEYYSVSDSLESLRQEARLFEMPRSHIQTLVQRRFNVNSVRRVHGNQVDVQKRNNRMTIRLDYEARTPVLANIDAVVRFSKQLELRNDAEPGKP